MALPQDDMLIMGWAAAITTAHGSHQKAICQHLWQREEGNGVL